MKKLLVSLITSVVILSLGSCDNEPEVFDSKNGSLTYFTAGTYAKFAAQDSGSDHDLFIEVGTTIKTNSDRTFIVEILEDDDPNDNIIFADATHFDIDNASLVIPANSYKGSIKLTTNFDRAPLEGSVFLKLKLVSIQDGIILQDSNIFTYELYRSCPKTISQNWIGFPSYNGIRDYASFNVSFTQVTNQENTWNVPTAWGPTMVSQLTGDNYNGQYLYSGQLSIKCDNTVEFVGNEGDLPGGTGTYDPDSGIIVVTLDQTLFTSSFTVTTTFIPL